VRGELCVRPGAQMGDFEWQVVFSRVDVYCRLWIQKVLHSERKCLIIEKCVFRNVYVEVCHGFLPFEHQWISPSSTQYLLQPIRVKLLLANPPRVLGV
jgi:hypothetical protein